MNDIVIVAGHFDTIVPFDLENSDDAKLFNDRIYRFQGELEHLGIIPAIAITCCSGPNPFQRENVDYDQIPKDEWTRYDCAAEMASLCDVIYAPDRLDSVSGLYINSTLRVTDVYEGDIPVSATAIVISRASLSPSGELGTQMINLIKKCTKDSGCVATLTESEQQVRLVCAESSAAPALITAASIDELIDLLHARIRNA